MSSRVRTTKRARTKKASSGRRRSHKSSNSMGATSGLTGYAVKNECNSVDWYNTISCVNDPQVTNCVNLIAAGTNYYQRVGGRIKMKSLHITGYVGPDNLGAAITFPQYARLVVVYDRQPGYQGNGASPLFSDILRNVSPGGLLTSDVYSGVNMVNRERFKILRDIRCVEPVQGLNGAEGATSLSHRMLVPDGKYLINEYIKLGGLEAHYNQVGGANISDIVTGAIWVFAIGQSSTANGSQWSFRLSSRLRYYDC